MKRWVDQFHHIGQRGSCVLPTYELPRNLTDIYPDFAILDNGGNDLVTTHSPLSVADAVININSSTHTTSDTSPYVLLYIALRTPAHIHRTTTTTESVATITYFDTTVTLIERYITYHTHRGLWQCPLHAWSHDGTHPKTTHGRKLYIKSLRRATHYSVKHVQDTRYKKLYLTSVCIQKH